MRLYFERHGKKLSKNVIQILDKPLFELDDEEIIFYKRVILPSIKFVRNALIESLNTQESRIEDWQEQLLFKAESIIGKLAMEIMKDVIDKSNLQDGGEMKDEHENENELLLESKQKKSDIGTFAPISSLNHGSKEFAGIVNYHVNSGKEEKRYLYSKDKCPQIALPNGRDKVYDAKMLAEENKNLNSGEEMHLEKIRRVGIKRIRIPQLVGAFPAGLAQKIRHSYYDYIGVKGSWDILADKESLKLVQWAFSTLITAGRFKIYIDRSIIESQLNRMPLSMVKKIKHLPNSWNVLSLPFSSIIGVESTVHPRGYFDVEKLFPKEHRLAVRMIAVLFSDDRLGVCGLVYSYMGNKANLDIYVQEDMNMILQATRSAL